MRNARTAKVRLASASVDNTVKVWDAASGALLRSLAGHQSTFFSVAWSPDGKSLASASDDHTVKVWDAASGAFLRSLAGHQSKVMSVVWSPNGKSLASASEDGTIRIWNPSNGQNTANISTWEGGEWLVFSPGKLAAYNSSFQGDAYASIRFDHGLRALYPLSLYRKQLRRGDWRTAPNPPIRPDLLYDGLITVQRESKWFLSGGILYVFGITVALLLVRRSDPVAVTRRFFSKSVDTPIKQIQPSVLHFATSYALVWQPDWPPLAEAVAKHRVNAPDRFKLYVISKEQRPDSEALQALRARLECEVIPLSQGSLETALKNDNCAAALRDLEEPFTMRSDPYDLAIPITNPVLFYGRESLLDRLPAALRQGQHVGVFGLRKIGKTSIINVLKDRLLATPYVLIDCQRADANARVLFEMVLEQLRADLAKRPGIKNLPERSPVELNEDFSRQLLALHERWKETGSREPFVLMLDEADKLFPDRRDAGSEAVLRESVRFFRVLRALAQERGCLALFVATYRSDINRQNQLTNDVGENPLYLSFQENFLGFLTVEETQAMLREIGLWKEIQWTPDALASVHPHTGGHPMLTRWLASEACDQGERKQIDHARMEEVTARIRASIPKHRIGKYYEESLWNMLYEEERHVLLRVWRNEAIPNDIADALTTLEHFGVVETRDGSSRVTASLLGEWLERTAG